MNQNRRLFRDAKTGMVCGVCSGLAQYFNLDVSLVRILVAFLSLAWGSGLILYLIAALVLPEKSQVL